MNKIAISGVHGTGKTTLINELMKIPDLQNFNFKTNLTRNLKQQGIIINEIGNDKTQLNICAKHLENYTYSNSILDRCALDGFTYTSVLFNNNYVSEYVFNIAKSIFSNLIYDVIFYIKPEFEIINDGTRSIDKKFHDDVFNMFEMIIKVNNIKIELLTGTIDQRVNQVIDILKQRNII
jgi:nicotinamide riboside kinase